MIETQGTSLPRIEHSLALSDNEPRKPGLVTRDLANADEYVLGNATDAGDESDLLHFTANAADGKEHLYLPVFSRLDLLGTAVQRVPEWEGLTVLRVKGSDVLASVDADVTLVLNPWTKLAFQLPPMRRPVAAGELATI